MAPAALLTPPFALGEVDLGTLGVDPASLATAGLAGASASSSPGDGPNMYIVDDDGASCPSARFTTIQDAVNASVRTIGSRSARGPYIWILGTS